MVNFLEVAYSQLTKNELKDIFSLRKKSFKDRLNWEVECIGEYEIDKYDNKNATYIIGIHRGDIICGARLIGMNKPNMIRDKVFQSFFYDDDIIINEKSIEVSRFFIDKEKVNRYSIKDYPLSSIMFTFFINHARKKQSDNICAIINHPMYLILKNSFWLPNIVNTGLSEKRKTIYYVTLPIDKMSTTRLFNNVSEWNTLCYG